MVEAGGVEPPSEKVSFKASTGLGRNPSYLGSAFRPGVPRPFRRCLAFPRAETGGGQSDGVDARVRLIARGPVERWPR